MYILIQPTHNKVMENHKKTTTAKTTTAKKTKKENAMKKIGKGIKEAFIEMSSSLAGWIEDTGTQFSRKKRTKKTQKQPSTTSQRSSSSNQAGQSSQTSN